MDKNGKIIRKGQKNVLTSIMDVRPWLVLPKPRPSFHPILCSILLPILLESSFLGFWSRCSAISACSMAARYFSFNLLGLGPSSSIPYFCRRSLARSRYLEADPKSADPKLWLQLEEDSRCCCFWVCSARQDSKLLRWRSDFSLCLKVQKKVPSNIDRFTFLLLLYLRKKAEREKRKRGIKLKNGAMNGVGHTVTKLRILSQNSKKIFNL